ncbi:hypothetical protein AgCh_000966 [Apium graveolens]
MLEKDYKFGKLIWLCGSSENQVLPPNFIKLAKDVYMPDFIAASDCKLGELSRNPSSTATGLSGLVFGKEDNLRHSRDRKVFVKSNKSRAYFKRFQVKFKRRRESSVMPFPLVGTMKNMRQLERIIQLNLLKAEDPSGLYLMSTF